MKVENISETIEFPKTLSLLGNLAIFVWIILDSVAFWLINQVAGWVFLVAALIAIYGDSSFSVVCDPASTARNAPSAWAE